MDGLRGDASTCADVRGLELAGAHQLVDRGPSDAGGPCCLERGEQQFVHAVSCDREGVRTCVLEPSPHLWKVRCDMGAPGLLGGQQFGSLAGRRGPGGPALLLTQPCQGQAQPAELLQGLQQLAGVGLADELHATQPVSRPAGPASRSGQDGRVAAQTAGRPVIGLGGLVDRAGPGPFDQPDSSTS